MATEKHTGAANRVPGPNHVGELIDAAHAIEAILDRLERENADLRNSLATANEAAAKRTTRRRYDQGYLDGYKEAEASMQQLLDQAKTQAAADVELAEQRATSANERAARADERADWYRERVFQTGLPTVENIDALLILPDAQLRNALRIARRELSKASELDPFPFALRWVRENMGGDMAPVDTADGGDVDVPDGWELWQEPLNPERPACAERIYPNGWSGLVTWASDDNRYRWYLSDANDSGAGASFAATLANAIAECDTEWEASNGNSS